MTKSSSSLGNDRTIQTRTSRVRLVWWQRMFRARLIDSLNTSHNSSRRVRLLVEGLEERRLLAVVGGACFEGLDNTDTVVPASMIANSTLEGDSQLQSQVVSTVDPVWTDEQSEARMGQLRELLADNESYRINEAGDIMSVDQPLLSPIDGLDGDDATAVTNGPAFGPYPYEQTFNLSSLPSATKTIYLDFTGHVITGTQWNSDFGQSTITIPPYNTSGSTSTFSNSEMDQIQWIWERVAEAYRPFNVNVTTLEPPVSDLIKSGGGDTRWGIRLTIGNDPLGTGAGGIAYIGSFNWSSDTPALVFQIGAGSTNAKYTADAAAHEAGHSLFLFHDGRTTPSEEYYQGHGSGATGWAPIMGVGYNRSLVQWSKGEYPNANETENDLNIITTQNGFSYRTDDHGGSIGAATPLTVVDSVGVVGDGIIERTTDVDYFFFNHGGGPVTLDIDPFYRGATLDVLATVYNSSGSVVATSNPTSALDASFSLNLPAGIYYLSIDGTGKAAAGADYGYSDYASLGTYTITGTIVPSGTVGTLTASLASGTLTIQDTDDADNSISVQYVDNTIIITDAVELFDPFTPVGTLSNGFKTLTVPLSEITGSVVFDLEGGTDTLDVGAGLLVPGLTVLDGSGNDTVNLNGSLTLGTNQSLTLSAENVNVASFSTMIITGSGTVSVNADNVAINESSGFFASGAASVATLTAGRPINLGTESAGQLSLTNAEVSGISGSPLTIGNASSGAMTVSSAITRSFSTNVQLRSGGDIVLDAEFDTGGGTLLLGPGSLPFGVSPTATGTDATASTVSFASALVIDINGSAVDSGYDQLNVAGTVNLAGVDLVLAGSFPGMIGNETFTIVSATNITNTFTGLPDLASIVVQGKQYLIDYSTSTVNLVPAETNEATIEQAYIYYKGSSFASGGVGNALDTSKTLVHEDGGTHVLGFNNLINSSRGINGIVFDINDLPGASLSSSDFTFQVSPQGLFSQAPQDWAVAAAPTSVSVVPGSPSRVVIEWADNSIANRWLRITVQANANTGLAQPEVYYIGHLLGETLGADGDGNFSVSFADIPPIREASGQVATPNTIEDINKSGTVEFADISAMRPNIAAQLNGVTISGFGGIPLQDNGRDTANPLVATGSVGNSTKSSDSSSLDVILAVDLRRLTVGIVTSHGAIEPVVSPLVWSTSNSQSEWTIKHDRFFEELALEENLLSSRL